MGWRATAVVRRVKSPVDGKDTVLYTVLPSVDIIKISRTGEIIPSTISCQKMKQVGSSAAVATTDKILRYQVSGGALTSYTGTLTVGSNWSYIDFILYDIDGITVLDKKRVAVVNDGYNGSAGPTLRGPSNWKTDTAYISGTGSEKFIDMIYYAANEKYYYCKVSHTSSNNILPTDSNFWVESSVFDFVATKVLFTQRAIIENAVVRYLQTADSAAVQRLEIFSNVMSVFNSVGALCMSIHGGAMSDTQSTVSVDPDDGAFEPVVVYENDSGYNTIALATFNVTAGNNIVTIPAITLEATAWGHLSLAGWCRCNVQLLLDNDVLNSITATNDSEPETSYISVEIPQSTRVLSVGQHTLSMYYEYECVFEPAPEDSLSVSAHATFASTARISVAYTYNFVELCGNGFRVKVASNMYVEFSFSNGALNIILRNGNYAFKIANDGFYKMINGADWVSASI